MLLVELVEGVEEFLLGGFLAGDELHIVDEEQIRLPVLAAKLNVLAGLDGGNQFVCKLVALDIHHVGVGIVPADAVGDGVEQMGLAHAGRAVDEQRIVNLARGLGDRDGRGVGEAVTWPHHVVVEGKLGVKIHAGGFVLVAEGVPLLIAENQQLGIGIEDLLQGILDVIGAAAADDVPAEIRGGVDDQVGVVQLHHLRVVQPGRHGDGPQLLLHIPQNLCPDIGGRVHLVCSFLSVWKPEKKSEFPFTAQSFNLNFITFPQKKQGFFVELEGKTAEEWN